jgi:hypothetical protein
MNGRAKKALRAVRSGPSRADQDRATSTSHATAVATYAPIGRRLTARMNATVAMNFSRASAACSQLGRAM